MLKVKIIVGSTRPGRVSEKLVPWLKEGISAHQDLEAEVLDLRDYAMPFYNDPRPASMITDGSYQDETVQRWAEKVKEADAFIFVTPEYNHGPSAVLKNALDSVYNEWARKAVAFVSYGSAGGARAVGQLRQNIIEMHMASTRASILIPAPWTLTDEQGNLKEGVLAPFEQARTDMLTQLVWWGNALQAARAQ